MATANTLEEHKPLSAGGNAADDNDVAAPSDPENARLDRAIDMVRSAFNNGQ